MSDEQPTEVRVRRAPKFGAFIAVGAVVGALVTLVLTSMFPVDPNVGFPALFAYFCLFGVSAGVALGAVLALILDRRSNKRSRIVEAEREEVEAPSEPEASAVEPEAPVGEPEAPAEPDAPAKPELEN